MVQDCDTVFFFATDCFEHAGHLVGLGGLKLIDQELKDYGRPWKYFSSLAVFTNTIRDCSKDIFKQWCHQHGEASAMKYVFKLFPRVCAGRWNSIDTTEDRILKAGPEKTVSVLRKVLEGKKVRANRKSMATPGISTPLLPPLEDAANAVEVGGAREDGAVSSTDAGVVDLLSLEQTKEYTVKMGKWRQQTIDTADDILWWRTIEVMHTIRGPVLHLSAFLKKKLSSQELAEIGPPLFQLICGKADSIFDAYNFMFADSFSWVSHACRGLNHADSSWLMRPEHFLNHVEVYCV
jgi:hypothetical protein